MIGNVLNERFLLERELDRGGMGTVYRATDKVLGRTVAVKVLSGLSGDEVGRRVKVEAQILARLLHDYVVRLYDFGEADGLYYLVMEEVEGSSFLKRWRQLDLPERLRILSQVADALDYAHHQGVIHRDVKPSNILLTKADQPKLADFGLSQLAHQSQESGMARGTPQYMSPEQSRARRVDHRTDLYSLGIILYECATGTTPFRGSAAAVLAQHVNADPEPPRARCPEVAEPLEALILSLLAKMPADRPSSGREVAKALRALIEPQRPTEPATAATSVALPAATSDAVPAAKSSATIPTTGISTKLPTARPALARTLIEAVEAEPVPLSADERYLCGHYLAYLLGGSRRQGFFRRRPLDPLNADRARLLLAMAAIGVAGGSDEMIARGAELLDQRHDVRPSLSPVVVMKFLAGRDTAAKRKQFRENRRRLQEASPYARQHLTNDQGVLNPGLIPQKLDDLRKVAPARTEVDDTLIRRWNRLAETWRADYGFRDAVLRYATTSAHRDPASVNLWPEVVYPLMERARWQRQLRSQAEALWDAVCSNLRIPDTGVRLDRAMQKAVPVQVAEEIDLAILDFDDEPLLPGDAPPSEAAVDASAGRPATTSTNTSTTIDTRYIPELADDRRVERGYVRLTSPDPLRLNLGELGALWREAFAALRTPGARAAHRPVPIGPYRLAVVPSFRSRSAGQIAIQGMPGHKQIELLTPSLRGSGTASRPIVAAWTYANNSLVVAYRDHRGSEVYVLWDAVSHQQANFDDAGALNHELLRIGMEAPDQVDRVLSKNYRPPQPDPKDRGRR